MKTVIFHPFGVEIKEGPYTHNGPENFLVNPEIPKDVPSIYWKLLNGKILPMNAREKEERDGFLKKELNKPVSKQELQEAHRSLTASFETLNCICEDQQRQIDLLKSFIYSSIVVSAFFAFIIKRFL